MDLNPNEDIIIERSFANGSLYKETISRNSELISENKIDNVISKYNFTKNRFLDKMYPLFSEKKGNGRLGLKYYWPSRQLYRYIVGPESDLGFDLESNYDLCISATMWIGVANYKDSVEEYELIFAVNDNKDLMEISKYYDLPFPLPKTESLDVAKFYWHSDDFKKACIETLTEEEFDNFNDEYGFLNDFKVGSIKFKNNKPYLLKMYKTGLRS